MIMHGLGTRLISNVTWLRIGQLANQIQVDICKTCTQSSGIGTTGALGMPAPIKIIVSSIYQHSFCIPTSIALSCSARTDVLNCSAGTDGTEMDRFFCQQTSSAHGAFSWFEASVLLKTLMFLNDCHSFLLSRITQQSPNCSTWQRAWVWSR